MEGDSGTGAGQPLGILFQSTPSAWRETSQFQCSFSCQKHFNPLPPHGGRRSLPVQILHAKYFNPLPPHGGRPDREYGKLTQKLFQSTPSAWRETRSNGHCIDPQHDFNPLPPHGGRLVLTTIFIVTGDFNPLPPHGGRLIPVFFGGCFDYISIHSLRMEGDDILSVSVT